MANTRLLSHLYETTECSTFQFLQHDDVVDIECIVESKVPLFVSSLDFNRESSFAWWSNLMMWLLQTIAAEIEILISGSSVINS